MRCASLLLVTRFADATAKRCIELDATSMPAFYGYCDTTSGACTDAVCLLFNRIVPGVRLSQCAQSRCVFVFAWCASHCMREVLVPHRVRSHDLVRHGFYVQVIHASLRLQRQISVFIGELLRFHQD